MFAIAAKLSFEIGFEGYVSFTAKTGLIEHYKRTLLAKRIGNTQKMYLDTFAAKALIETYFDRRVKYESNK